MAYAGSNRQDVLNVLLHVFPDPKSSMEVGLFGCFGIFIIGTLELIGHWN